jgi:hypothetical protein
MTQKPQQQPHHVLTTPGAFTSWTLARRLGTTQLDPWTRTHLGQPSAWNRPGPHTPPGKARCTPTCASATSAHQ